MMASYLHKTRAFSTGIIGWRTLLMSNLRTASSGNMRTSLRPISHSCISLEKVNITDSLSPVALTFTSPSPVAPTTLRSLLSSCELNYLQRISDPSVKELVDVTLDKVSVYHNESSDVVSLLEVCQHGDFKIHKLVKLLGNLLAQHSNDLCPQSLSKVVTCLRELHEEELANVILMSSSEQILSERAQDLSHDLIMSLVTSNHMNAHIAQLLGDYVVTKIPTLNFKFLIQLLSEMLQHRCLSRSVLTSSAEAACSLIKNEPGEMRNLNLGKLFWVFGKFPHYDEQLCRSVSQFIVNGKDRQFNPWMLTSIVWYFARVRYYDPVVMETIAQYALRHINRFIFRDLSNLVYSFGSLNHIHHELMSAVAKRLIDEPSTRNNEQTYWMFVWASMVMDVHYSGVLSRVLTEDFIEASLKMPDYQLCLLQLSIALNHEHPELQFNGDKTKMGRWGDCFPSIADISKEYMKMSTLVRLKRYRHHDSALTFVENVKRALKLVIGDYKYFNTEALSLCGYTLDFELLLDSKNRLIPIPRRWKMKQKGDVLKSIGASGDAKPHKRDCLNTADLIESMETAESSTERSNQSSRLVMPDSYEHRVQINLASDWGTKFALMKEHVSRKIAIEADGYPHFARNCDHVMGPTVLKHRQLKALGWEVVQIPYTEWQHLQSGDEHAQYIAKKIFRTD